MGVYEKFFAKSLNLQGDFFLAGAAVDILHLDPTKIIANCSLLKNCSFPGFNEAETRLGI